MAARTAYAAIVVLALLGLAGWFAERAQKRSFCDPDQVRAAYNIDRRWADQRELALASAHAAPVVAELQAIRRELQDAKAPECLTEARRQRLTEMTAFVNSLLTGGDEMVTSTSVAISAHKSADALMAQVRERLFPDEVQAEVNQKFKEEGLALEAQRRAVQAKERTEQARWAEEKARIDEMVPDESPAAPAPPP